MMKKMGLCIAMICLMHITVFAYSSITVYVDGVQIEFDQMPVIKDDRTLVPMRKIFEALGAEVSWDLGTRSVTAVRGADVIFLQIGKTALYKNGAIAYTMPVPAQIIQDRTFVPLRAVAESFGAEVTWDGKNGVIQIFEEQTPQAPVQLEQELPKNGEYSVVETSPNGSTALRVELRCDEVTQGKGMEQINGTMANLLFTQGKTFLETHKETAVATNPSGTVPKYYCVGSYQLMREETYASFYGSVTTCVAGWEESSFYSMTYDMATGKRVELKQLVSDTQAELEHLWEASFGALIAAEPTSFYWDATERLQENLGKVNFYLTKDGIVFYLPPGVIAPAQSGVISFEIAYTF